MYPQIERWDPLAPLDPKLERKIERQRKAREQGLDEMQERHATYVRALQGKAFKRISTIEANVATDRNRKSYHDTL